MNAHPKFIATTAHVDDAAVHPLPRSSKVYVEGSRAGIRVPMRRIEQTDTPASFGAEKNPPVYVYDTSGPYTDPAARIDIRSGLPALRAKWIEERCDTVLLDGPTSRYGQERLADPKLAELRFELKRTPRRAKPGANVSQMHYARRGIVTPEMEFVRHPREPAPPPRIPRGGSRPPARSARRWPRSPRPPASRRIVRRFHSRPRHARVRARRGGARPSHHPCEREPPGNRADGDRPQLPGEDQRQHRQLRRELFHRRGSRQDDLGHPLGRRHGDGPVHRPAHPRDPRMDHPQLAGAHRNRAHLPGTLEKVDGKAEEAHLGRSTATR